MSESTQPREQGPERERWRIPRPSIAEWLCLFGGLFLVKHYGWLYDDAFIYFRYVDNFLYLDFGLVYNKGEYAEGFTSPLWALILIVLRPIEVGWWTIILGIAYLSFIAYWWALVVLNRRVVGERFVPINLPLCYSVFVYGVSAYFTSGLESPLIQVVAIGYALFIFNPRSIVPLLLVAISPLIRPELALPLVMATAWCAYRRRQVPWLLILSAFVFNGAWLVFRIYTYADLLPVTFYLKDIVDIPQGLTYVNNTFGEYYAYPLFVAGAAVFAILWRRSPVPDWAYPAERAVILLIAGAVAVYVIKIGGNAQHFRYLSFSFCLALCALAGIPEWGVSQWMKSSGSEDGSNSRRALPVGLSLGLGVLFALWGFWGYPPQLSSHPFFERSESQWVNKIYDSYWHRHHDLFVRNIIKGEDQIDLYELYREEDPLLRYHGIDSSFWCGDNYRRLHMRMIHSLGLTDPILARTIMKSDRPSHKFGLIPLAEQMVDLQREFSAERGCYRRAVEAGKAPEWIVQNLDSIEKIEAKSHNRHDFLENLRLALTPIKPIDPGPEVSGSAARMEAAPGTPPL